MRNPPPEDDSVARLRFSREAETLSPTESADQTLCESSRPLDAEVELTAPFRTTTVSAGRCTIVDLMDVSEALALAEGEAYE